VRPILSSSNRNIVRSTNGVVTVHLLLKNRLAAVIILDDLGLDDRASVEVSTTNEPVQDGSDENRNEEHNRVVHVVAGDWAESGKEEDDGDECGPAAGPDVDEVAESAHMPGTRLEAAEDDFAEDGDAVGPVEADGANVEDAEDRLEIVQYKMEEESVEIDLRRSCPGRRD
jgi:hypothetical protein